MGEVCQKVIVILQTIFNVSWAQTPTDSSALFKVLKGYRYNWLGTSNLLSNIKKVIWEDKEEHF